jgi:hypothetical protein
VSRRGQVLLLVNPTIETSPNEANLFAVRDQLNAS